MDNIKVSVCISVHNTETYLRRCLDSVISQTIESMEIVLVNNGSDDSSLDIMQEYKNKYPRLRIKIITQEDRGLAQGRQTGVDNAEGEYVAFVDADDYIEPSMYEIMYQEAVNNGAEIIECQTFRDGDILGSGFDGVYDSKDILVQQMNKDCMQPMLWLRIYKRNLFKSGVLPKDYINNEDIFALPCLLYNSDKIMFIRNPFYHYSSDNENAVMASNSAKDKLRSIKYNRNYLLAVNHVEHYIGKQTVKEKLKDNFTEYKLRACMKFILNAKEIAVGERVDYVCDFFNMTLKDLELMVRKSLNKKSRLYFIIKFSTK